MIVPVYSPTEGAYVGYSLPASLPMFVAICFLDGHFDKNEIEFQGTFNFRSPPNTFRNIGWPFVFLLLRPVSPIL